MADAQQNKDNEDLSMEEILQSIRKIISDDDEQPTDGGSGEATDESTTEDGDGAMTEETTAEEDAEAAGSDVLELTDVMEEVEEEAEPEPEAVDVLKEIDEAIEEPAPEPEPEPEPEPVAEEPAPEPTPKPEPVADTTEEEANRLLSDDAATASAASLQKVVATHKSANPSPGFRSGTSVEELVLESIKPMLKDWLDANLPSMVERIVEREIRKLID